MITSQKLETFFLDNIGMHPDDLFGVEIDQLPSPEKFPNWFWDTIDQADCSEETFKNLVSNFSQVDLIKFYVLFEEADESILTDDHFAYMHNHSFPFDVEECRSDYTYAIVSRGREFYFSVCKDPSKLPSSPDYPSPLFIYVLNAVFEEKFPGDFNLWDVADNFKTYYDLKRRGK